MEHQAADDSLVPANQTQVKKAKAFHNHPEWIALGALAETPRDPNFSFVRHCCISFHNSSQQWQGLYPGRDPPSFSKCATMRTHRCAILLVLEWMWQRAVEDAKQDSEHQAACICRLEDIRHQLAQVLQRCFARLLACVLCVVCACLCVSSNLFSLFVGLVISSN